MNRLLSPGRGHFAVRAGRFRRTEGSGRTETDGRGMAAARTLVAVAAERRRAASDPQPLISPPGARTVTGPNSPVHRAPWALLCLFVFSIPWDGVAPRDFGYQPVSPCAGCGAGPDATGPDRFRTGETVLGQLCGPAPSPPATKAVWSPGAFHLNWDVSSSNSTPIRTSARLDGAQRGWTEQIISGCFRCRRLRSPDQKHSLALPQVGDDRHTGIGDPAPGGA